MKLIDLNLEIKSIRGINILDIGGKDSLTFRSALISCVEFYKPEIQGKGEALKALDLGIKILNAKEELEVTKEELELIKKIVETSSVWTAVVTGWLEKRLNSIT